MFSDKYFEKFKTLCGIASDSSTMQIQELRRIILFRSNGLCPARFMVTMRDGSFLSAKEMCNEDTYAFVKRKSLLQFSQDMEAFIEKARQTEVKMMSSSKIKCSIGSSSQQKLQALVDTHTDDCKAFRQSLLASDELSIVAIHLCRWDGSPRKSISEIRDAICLYPSSPQKMNAFLKLFLASLAALAVYVAVDQLLLSESAKVSHHQCNATSVTLVGESHGKKIRGAFLPRFVEKLHQEGNNPQTVVFVEARPWFRETGTTEDFETAKKYVSTNLSKFTPAIYFSLLCQLELTKTVFPHHDIVAYDYRDLGLFDILLFVKRIPTNYRARTLDIEEFLRQDVFLPYLPKDAQILKNLFNKQHDRLIERFPYLANELKQKAGEWVQRLLSPNLTQDQANVVVNEIWIFWFSISDETLVQALKPYVERGYPNIYVFMGSAHIPTTQLLMKERLDC